MENNMSSLKDLGLNNEQIAYLKSNPETKALLADKGWLEPPITKKIKVMQEDGTLSPFIHYGTEAKYVDVTAPNGQKRTLEEQLIYLQQYIDGTLDDLIGGSY